jgi:hypothetical protein
MSPASARAPLPGLLFPHAASPPVPHTRSHGAGLQESRTPEAISLFVLLLVVVILGAVALF